MSIEARIINVTTQHPINSINFLRPIFLSTTPSLNFKTGVLGQKSYDKKNR